MLEGAEGQSFACRELEVVEYRELLDSEDRLQRQLQARVQEVEEASDRLLEDLQLKRVRQLKRQLQLRQAQLLKQQKLLKSQLGALLALQHLLQ